MKQALKHPFFVAPPKDRFSASLLTTVNQIVDQANVDVIIGPLLQSQDSLTVTAKYHHVAGTAAIKHIVVPPTFSGGEVKLIPDAAWTTVTGGNIGATSTAVPGKVITLVYDGVKWWPTY